MWTFSMRRTHRSLSFVRQVLGSNGSCADYTIHFCILGLFAEAERANYEVAVFYSEIPVISSFLIPTQETIKGDCKNGMDQRA